MVDVFLIFWFEYYVIMYQWIGDEVILDVVEMEEEVQVFGVGSLMLVCFSVVQLEVRVIGVYQIFSFVVFEVCLDIVLLYYQCDLFKNL